MIIVVVQFVSISQIEMLLLCLMMMIIYSGKTCRKWKS